MLLEIVRENITTDMMLFNSMFNDFGNREKGTTLELNKRFIGILNDIVKNTPKTRKVSFDKQIDTHKQNFLSYLPKPPVTPIFADMVSKEPLRNLDELIKDTIANRQYEPVKSPSDPKINILPPKVLDIEPIPVTESSNYLNQSVMDLGVAEISNTYNSSHEISNIMQTISNIEIKIDILTQNISDLVKLMKQSHNVNTIIP
jgi:hypothetical protein